MDNSVLIQIETLGAKVYFFGECVWATLLKVKSYHIKIAIIGGNKRDILTVLPGFIISDHQAKTYRVWEDDNTLYEFYFLDDIQQIPLDPISINNSILSLDGKIYREEGLLNKIISIDKSVFLDHPEEMLRICRISAQSGYKIDVPTWTEILKNNRLIKNKLGFVKHEIFRIIMSDHPDIGLTLLYELGLLRFIFPELDRCNEIAQTRRGMSVNVFTHTLLALKASEQTELIRWTILFHDMAKPLTMEITEDGKMHFFKHEFTGATLAEHYMKQMRLDDKLIRNVKNLIENHMFDADPKLTQKGVRRLIRRVGKDLIFELLKVREADRNGSPTPPSGNKIELLRQKIILEYNNV
jgi:putative nucleotidyltransferase with HDIG domain